MKRSREEDGENEQGVPEEEVKGEEEEEEKINDSWKDSDFLCFDTNDNDNENKKENDVTNNAEDDVDDGDLPTKRRRRDSAGTSVNVNTNKNRNNNRNGRNNRYGNDGLTCSIINQEKKLPPWMDKSHDSDFHRNTPAMILLHEEIVKFVNLMKPQPSEIEVRNKFVDQVKEIILNLFANESTRDGDDDDDSSKSDEKKKDIYSGCEVHVFGSQATGLLLPTSDVDLVVMLPKYEDGNEKNDSTASSNANGNANGKSQSDAKDKSQKKKKEKKKKKNKNRKNDGEDSTEEESKKEDTEAESTKTSSKNKRLSLTKEEEEQEMAEYDIYKHSSTHYDEANASPLVKIAKELKSKWKDELTYLEVVENTKVPIVKFTHGPTQLQVDICLNQENGVQAAELMKRFMDAMPPLKPMAFILKYFMVARGLNEPYSGGIGSFMLQMMIVSFLQHRERYDFDIHHSKSRNRHRNWDGGRGRNDYDDRDDEFIPAPMNLGSLLIEFFELYAMDFNYLTTAISVRNDGFYFPKGHHQRREHFFTNPSRAFTLGIENPIDTTMDIGKSSFRMQLIQKSYEVALRVLLSHVSYPCVPTDSILESIIPATEEMYKRATMYKVLKIEEQLKKQGYSLSDSNKHNKRSEKTSSKQRRKSSDSSMDTSASD